MGHVLNEDETVDIVQARHEEEKVDEEEGEEDLDDKPIPFTETHNALNAHKQGPLGRGFVDNGNLLAKLEKASSQVLTADSKQTTIIYYVFFSRAN